MPRVPPVEPRCRSATYWAYFPRPCSYPLLAADAFTGAENDSAATRPAHCPRSRHGSAVSARARAGSAWYGRLALLSLRAARELVRLAQHGVRLCTMDRDIVAKHHGGYHADAQLVGDVLQFQDAAAVRACGQRRAQRRAIEPHALCHLGQHLRRADVAIGHEIRLK